VEDGAGGGERARRGDPNRQTTVSAPGEALREPAVRVGGAAGLAQRFAQLGHLLEGLRPQPLDQGIEPARLSPTAN